MSDQPEIPVAYYGLHKDQDGIDYLHQGPKNAANFLGLKKASPFYVQKEKNKMCPHVFNPMAPQPDRIPWNNFVRLMADNLVKEMLPIPKAQFQLVPYFNDPQNDLPMVLTLLSKLSSPIFSVVHPLKNLREKEILELLESTNVTPLVLTGVRTEDQMRINSLCKEARLKPRHLILTGASEVVIREPMQRLTTDVRMFDTQDLALLPMEQLGVAVMRRYARGERLDSPYERKGD